jgi:muconate cycloisomerase
LAASPTIRAVEAVPVRVEGAREFRISEGATRVHVSVVLRLLTDVDGLEGNAEVVSAPPGKPEEFLEEIVGAIERYVAPALIGMPVRERGRAVQAVAMALKGRVWTKAAVTNALYDLHAKAIGVPIADLLGGQLLQRVPVIGPVVGIMTPDAMATEAAAQSKAGFLAIKIKVGETVEADIDRVAAVRAAIGESMALRVDANDHYCPADAIRFTRAIERHRPEHIEQPVARHDMLGLAEVRRSVGVPIMTDDMVATPYDAMNVIRLGAADRVKVKVTKHGFDGARAICAMLSSAGLTPVLGHVFEMGLAAIAEAQFAACTPGLAMPCEIGSMAPMGTHADIVTNDLRPVPGYMTVPTGLGLGADVDWQRVRRGPSESAA